MDRILKHAFVILGLFIFGCKATAQKFATHAVKQGETLETIAKHYNVTPNSILTYNKEIRQGQALRPNTILVVPIDLASTSSGTHSAGASQEEPIGFTSHTVGRKETLYAIAKRYRVKEEDIKKYNPQLYSAQLQRKMELRIPKYRRQKGDEEIEDGSEDYVTYLVSVKETRWSIANKHGITVDRMLELNPELSASNDYLRVGQELKLPRLPGSTIEGQETQLFISYTVPPKMNFYRLEQEFGIKSDEVVRLNPEIAEKGGLKEGMIIRLPQKKMDAGEVNTDNFIFYEVKPKQTEFSLTRKLGITYKDLLDLNPDLKNGLKAGMVLKLPKGLNGDFEVKNALILDKFNILDSIDPANRPKLMFLLPFRLDRLDLNDREALAKSIDSRTDIKLSLGLYSGALVALDSIAKLGISVDVKTFDNQLDLNRTKEILNRETLMGVSAIIGPLDANSLKEVAVRAATYQVPVVAPIPAATDLSLKNVFFSYTSDAVLRRSMLDYVKNRYTDQNIIVIADKANKAVKDSILIRFPLAKIAQVKEEDKDIGVNIDRLKSLLARNKENWVFVETDNFRLISSVSSILNSLNSTAVNQTAPEKIKVRMLTTNKGKAYDNELISSPHLSNLNFTYPSVYREVDEGSFVRNYQNRFGETPDKWAVRGFDMTFDLLLKLAYRNNLMEASQLIGGTEYTGNKFSYEKDFASGYFNQGSYIMSFDNMRIKEVKEQ